MPWVSEGAGVIGTVVGSGAGGIMALGNKAPLGALQLTFNDIPKKHT